MKKSTTELLKLIEKTPTFKEYEVQAEEEFIEEIPLNGHLTRLRKEKEMSIGDIVRRSNLNRTYVYDIFSGARKPSRDKVLAICFALGLSADETQGLLRSAKYPQLYARIRRDSAILHALEHQMSLTDTNSLLYELDGSCL